MSSILHVKIGAFGYHLYQVVWEPGLGDILVAVHDSGNDSGNDCDRHVMAVYHNKELGAIVLGGSF